MSSQINPSSTPPEAGDSPLETQDDGGVAETERLHSAACRAQEAQRQHEADILQAGYELGKASSQPKPEVGDALAVGWLPTAANINALPEPLRKYIHDLETRCDPAGDTRELTIARDTCHALSAEIEDVRLAHQETRGTVAALKQYLAKAEAELARVRGVETGDQDAAGGSLPNTRIRQDELPTGDSCHSSLPAACLDCGLPYKDFPLDMLFPCAQWLAIHPDEGGLLCAQCMITRASKIPGATVVHAVVEIAPSPLPPAPSTRGPEGV